HPDLRRRDFAALNDLSRFHGKQDHLSRSVEFRKKSKTLPRTPDSRSRAPPKAAQRYMAAVIMRMAANVIDRVVQIIVFRWE
ncbi:MAG: hypothetical protein O3C57_00190, partial [Verrucomicrobia bacterium]|nr:hypothetical protein [Verrucomicrobiota bacterium]